MNITSAVAVAKKVLKMTKKAREYFEVWEVDQQKLIRITKDLNAGKFLRECPDFECEDFEIKNGVMRIYATGDRKPICDGASLAPDKVAGFDVVASSVVHDCLYHYLESIAHSWGWYVKDVRRLADEAFGCDMLHRAKAEKNPAKRFAYSCVAYVYYYAVRLFGGIYHKTKAGLFVLSVMLFLAGCSIPATFAPTGEELHYVITNIVKRIESIEKPTPAPAPAKPSTQADEVDYSQLIWCYGGFNGAGATRKDGVIIRNLTLNNSGMAYAWQAGNCEMLGASGHTNADCVACLFCLVDGKWKGGKFEWISTSRTTRSWHNLHGYNGWRFEDYEQAKEVCFVIVSRNGKTRSNIIKAVK